MPIEPHSNLTVFAVANEVARLATVAGDSLTALTPSATGGVTPISAASAVYAGGGPPGATTDGNDTTPVSGTIYVAGIYLPENKTLTGVSFMNGTVAGTDKVITALYSTAGVLLANSATAGTTPSGVDAFQRVDFTSTFAAKGPQAYYLAIQFNGTTTRFNTHPLGAHNTISQTGVFATLAALSPLPTTFVANVGPIAAVY